MSGFPPPGGPQPSGLPWLQTELGVLKAILATLQVIAAVLTILTLLIAGWLLGIFPDIVSPLVEVRVG